MFPSWRVWVKWHPRCTDWKPSFFVCLLVSFLLQLRKTLHSDTLVLHWRSHRILWKWMNKWQSYGKKRKKKKREQVCVQWHPWWTVKVKVDFSWRMPFTPCVCMAVNDECANVLSATLHKSLVLLGHGTNFKVDSTCDLTFFFKSLFLFISLI